MMLNASSVKITLGGKERHLEASLDAILVMNRAYGGMKNLHTRVRDMDLEAMTVAIRCGLMIDGEEAEGLMEVVYKTGLISLLEPVAHYVLLCASGGVMPDEEDDVEGDTEPGKP